MRPWNLADNAGGTPSAMAPAGASGPGMAAVRQGPSGRGPVGTTAERPEGVLLWLHCGYAQGPGPLRGVIRRLARERPDVSVLLTSAEPQSGTVAASPDGCMLHPPPPDAEGPAGRFLEHWRPDAVLWAGPLDAVLRPRTLAALGRRRVPVVLVGAGGVRVSRWRWWLGPSAAALAGVTLALVEDSAAAMGLHRIGLPRKRLQVTGPLRDEAEPPPCEEPQRARMAARLDARPGWLAAHLLPGEEEAVLRAHATVLRSSRRLLLVLAPQDPARGAQIAPGLAGAGWAVTLRSAGGEPGPDTQVVIADRPGELGLWYRIAPVTLLGSSLVPGGGQDPGAAAALGTAILHGPHVAHHVAAYERLARAGGARLVTDAESLAAALARVIQPEEAARMAHAAWDVGTSGAEVAERVIKTLLALLPRPAGA